jgi:hypothetical protein
LYAVSADAAMWLQAIAAADETLPLAIGIAGMRIAEA